MIDQINNSKINFRRTYLDENPDDIRKANSSKSVFRSTYLDERIEDRNVERKRIFFGGAFLAICALMIAIHTSNNDANFENFVMNNLHNEEVVNKFKADIEKETLEYEYIDDFDANMNKYQNFFDNSTVNTINENNKNHLFTVYKKNTEKKKKVHSIHHLNKDDYKNFSFLEILFKTEDYREKFYKDNKGIAIIYAWNISTNSDSFNREIIKQLKLDKDTADKIMKWSAKPVSYVPEELSQISIDISKTAGAVNYMYDFYYNEFKDVLLSKYEAKLKQQAKRDKSINENTISIAKKLISQRLDNSFNDDEKAIFAHMAYKLGKNNLNQYNKFYSKINNIITQNNFTREAFEDLAEHRQFNYKVNNKYIRDVKTERIHNEYLTKRF